MTVAPTAEAAQAPARTPRPEVGTETPLDLQGWRQAITEDPMAASDMLCLLHRPVGNHDDLIEVLHSAVLLAARHVEGVAHASVTAALGSEPAEPFTAATSDLAAWDFDEQQYALGDGPCLQAMRTHTVVALSHTQLQQRWPALGGSTTNHLQQFLSIPLSATATPRLSLNLYAGTPGTFSQHPSPLLRLLSELLTRAVTEYSTLQQAVDLTHQLRAALEAQAPIEQAKGILMATHHVTADAGSALLRQRSQHSHSKLRDVAAALVASYSHQPPPTPQKPDSPDDTATDLRLTLSDGGFR